MAICGTRLSINVILLLCFGPVTNFPYMYTLSAKIMRLFMHFHIFISFFKFYYFRPLPYIYIQIYFYKCYNVMLNSPNSFFKVTFKSVECSYFTWKP